MGFPVKILDLLLVLEAVPRLGIQGFRLGGPNAWGSKPLSVVSIMPGPSQRQKTLASGPNSLRT